MLVDLKQIIAYICPNCANINIEKLNIFKFSGRKKVSLKCGYGHDEKCVIIEDKKDKYKIEIVCPVCGEVHFYNMKKTTFWNCKYISFRCPLSGIEIYFHGNEQRVAKALQEQNEMLNEYGSIDNQITDSEEVLIDNIISYINFLLDSDSVRCSCGNMNIQFDLDENSIILRCSKCGKKKHIYLDEQSLQDIINSTMIIL